MLFRVFELHGHEMQRYFFELRLRGRRLKDDEGEEFANFVEALKYGRLVACELLQEHDASAMINAFVVVLDENGDELGRIYLSDLSEASSSLQRAGRALH